MIHGLTGSEQAAAASPFTARPLVYFPDRIYDHQSMVPGNPVRSRQLIPVLLQRPRTTSMAKRLAGQSQIRFAASQPQFYDRTAASCAFPVWFRFVTIWLLIATIGFRLTVNWYLRQLHVKP